MGYVEIPGTGYNVFRRVLSMLWLGRCGLVLHTCRTLEERRMGLEMLDTVVPILCNVLIERAV